MEGKRRCDRPGPAQNDQEPSGCSRAARNDPARKRDRRPHRPERAPASVSRTAPRAERSPGAQTQWTQRQPGPTRPRVAFSARVRHSNKPTGIQRSHRTGGGLAVPEKRSQHADADPGDERCRSRTNAVAKPRRLLCAREHESGSRPTCSEAPASRQSQGCRACLPSHSSSHRQHPSRRCSGRTPVVSQPPAVLPLSLRKAGVNRLAAPAVPVVRRGGEHRLVADRSPSWAVPAVEVPRIHSQK